MKLLLFENNKGHILIEDDYITLFNYDFMEKSKKFPLYRVHLRNVKILHDVLKIANLGKLFLTEIALKKFDETVEEWEGK